MIETISKSKHITSKEFMYANNRRFTITGKLPLRETEIQPAAAAVTGGVYTGIFLLQHFLQQNTIWKEVGPFHTYEDAEFTLWLDKPGHFFGTYLPCYVMQEALFTSGLSYDASAIWGGVLGLAYNSYVEILDGYSIGFGFSPSDFYADIAGATFFVAQHFSPFLQNFTPKFQYIKPSWHGELDRYPSDAFIDNYSAQTFWMSVNVYNLLPTGMKKYWVPWLDLSVGYAVYSLCNPRLDRPCTCQSEKQTGATYGNPKLLISLDWNLQQMFPNADGFLGWLIQSANYFKLPSPVLEIGTKDVKFSFIYPFYKF
ncbi:MAG: DUF2279 domain-containing protein [Chloroflexota bacterium]